MNTLQALLAGFEVAMAPANLLWAFVGTVLGTAVGVLPGIGPALTIALLLPVTGQLEPTQAFIMFAGILYGAMYGGSTTSILLNTPGESSSMITALEGNLMARSGRGAAALATAAIGSFVAGTIGTVGLTFAAPWMAEIAFVFGPAEYFALMMLSFTCVSAVLGKSLLRGCTALCVGLALGVIGIDSLTGQARLTFGMAGFLDGIEFTVVLVGLFAIGETLYAALHERQDSTINKVSSGVWLSLRDFNRSIGPWLRGTVIGFPIGALPAGGSEVPTFISYSLERKLAKDKSEFGHGAIEGVAGPEAANNAAAAGMLIPLLTLGLPTSATTAVLLTAFQSYGLQPGPHLFTSNPALVWGLIASLYIGNVMLLVLNLPLATVWVRLLLIPRPYLYASIMVFALVGVWGISTGVDHLVLLAVVGVLGYGMRRFDYPIAPVLIGLILGPMAERHLRQALSISQGDPMGLFRSPLSTALLVLAAMVVATPIIAHLARRAMHGRKPRNGHHHLEDKS